VAAHRRHPSHHRRRAGGAAGCSGDGVEVTELLPRCLLAWIVCCGAAWLFGLLLALVDLWEQIDITKEQRNEQ